MAHHDASFFVTKLHNFPKRFTLIASRGIAECWNNLIRFGQDLNKQNSISVGLPFWLEKMPWAPWAECILKSKAARRKTCGKWVDWVIFFIEHAKTDSLFIGFILLHPVFFSVLVRFFCLAYTVYTCLCSTICAGTADCTLAELRCPSLARTRYTLLVLV